mgnify:CR=1 FL=1
MACGGATAEGGATGWALAGAGGDKDAAGLGCSAFCATGEGPTAEVALGLLRPCDCPPKP